MARLTNGCLDNIALFKHCAYDLSNLYTYRITETNEKKKIKAYSHTEIHILYCLALHRQNIHMQCNPKMSTLANDAGCSKKTVQRALDKFVKNKVLIKKKYRLGNGNRFVRIQYFFTWDLVDAMEMYNDPDSDFSRVDAHADKYSWFEECYHAGEFNEFILPEHIIPTEIPIDKLQNYNSDDIPF